jgi:hypothetical protein
MAMRINRATSPEIVDRNKQSLAAQLHKAAVLFRYSPPTWSLARVIANLRAVWSHREGRWQVSAMFGGGTGRGREGLAGGGGRHDVNRVIVRVGSKLVPDQIGILGARPAKWNALSSRARRSIV